MSGVAVSTDFFTITGVGAGAGSELPLAGPDPDGRQRHGADAEANPQRLLRASQRPRVERSSALARRRNGRSTLHDARLRKAVGGGDRRGSGDRRRHDGGRHDRGRHDRGRRNGRRCLRSRRRRDVRGGDPPVDDDRVFGLVGDGGRLCGGVRPVGHRRGCRSSAEVRVDAPAAQRANIAGRHRARADERGLVEFPGRPERCCELVEVVRA